MKNTIINCPRCKSSEVVKRGYFQTEAHGKQQRYFCKSCNKKFIEQTPFYRMRNNEKKITLCIDLFYRGVSTRKVQEHLNAFYPHNSDHSNIYRWIVKYSKMVSEFTNRLKLNVGSEAQTDEVEFHRRKSHKSKLGTEKNFFIDSIDPTTKFMISSEYMKDRSSKNVKAVMSRIKERTESQIKFMTTDGLRAYPRVIKKVFGYDNTQGKFNVIHHRNIAIKDEGFNYPIERLHNNIRARTKTFRGFHGSINSANAIMKGWEIYYNFITKHQTINCCPFELAIPKLKDKLNVNNKWLALINMATQ
ncbi:MAG: DDE-type integrase/transposase/recombinase, partial [Nanoarchaeota archaeon]